MSSLSKWIPKNPKRLIAVSGCVAVAVSLTYAVPQLGSSRNLQRAQVVTERMAERGVPFAATEALEARRSEYLSILTGLHEISEIYGGNAHSESSLTPQGARSKAERSMGMVHNLSDAELSMMIEVTPDITPLVQATRNLLQIARSQQQSSQQSILGGNSQIGSGPNNGPLFSGGFPGAPYSPEYGSVRPTTAAILAASTTFEIADDVRELAGRACDETIVAIGVGGNTALICLISDAVWVVAKTVFWQIQFWSSDVDGAEIEGTYDRVGHLHTDIESLQSSITAHNSNIDGDLIAHNANIDADIVAHNLNIQNRINSHDANIDADLVAHDANLDMHDSDIKGLMGDVQDTLANKIELRKVHLQAMQVDRPEHPAALPDGEPVPHQGHASGCGRSLRRSHLPPQRGHELRSD